MQTRYRILTLLMVAYLLTALVSCNNQVEDDGHSQASSERSNETVSIVNETDEENEDLHLTKEQMETIDLQFGTFSSIKIDDYISATGTLGLPPNAYASATSRASGIIKGSKEFIEGGYIKKGTVVAYVENPEFIEKQQEYLEVRAELDFLRKDLQRQRDLVAANAGVVRNVEKLQSEVNMKNVQLKATRKYLNFLGISTDNITADNIRQQIAVIAPMSGYITSVSMHNGKYIEPSDEMLHIINNNHLHLELDVFEKDIDVVNKGQKITYTLPALGSDIYEGSVHVLGKEFNTENKTVRIHGHLEGKKPKPIKDLFVNAKIWLTDQTVDALPDEAIIRNEQDAFIYVGDADSTSDEIEFEKIMVITSVADKGFTAVKLLNEIPEGMEVVTKGSYYIYAQSMAGDLEHEH